MDSAAFIAGFLRIVADLCHAVAVCGARGAWGGDPATITAIHRRLTRLAARFRVRAERHQAGLSRPVRPPAPRPSPRRDEAAQAAPRLPRRRGFVAAGGHEIRGHAAQLAHLLVQPGAKALIEADPAFGRVLRPLCHLLGIAPPDFLAPPPRDIPLPARRQPKPRRPRPKPRDQDRWREAWRPHPREAETARRLWLQRAPPEKIPG